MKNTKDSIFIIILLLIVIFLFIGINFKFNKDNRVNNVPPNPVNPENSNYETDNILINGVEEEIKVVKYNSHLGFSLFYDVEKFRPVLLSDGAVEFVYFGNQDVKLRIEKLLETDYYEKYNNGISEEIIDNLRYSYKYMRERDFYYCLVIIIPEYLEETDIYTRLDYMTSRFDIN